MFKKSVLLIRRRILMNAREKTAHRLSNSACNSRCDTNALWPTLEDCGLYYQLVRVSVGEKLFFKENIHLDKKWGIMNYKRHER